MSVKLITKSHLSELLNILEGLQSEVLIISPFISKNMTDMLCDILRKKPEVKCTVISRYYFDDFIKGVSSIDSLYKFIECGADVYALQDLHTKLYLFDDCCGMLGSANFTSGGFFLNHELSILVDENESVLEDMRQYYDQVIELILQYGNAQVTKEKIDSDLSYISTKRKEYQKQAKQGIKCTYGKKFGAKIKLPHNPQDIQYDSVQKLFDKAENVENIKYFLKPIGATETPFEEGHLLKGDKLYFSKTFPRAVTKGSILICYSVGTQKLIGIYESTSDMALEDPTPSNERWPYYVESRELSPKFSKCWWQYSLVLKELLTDYIEFFPDRPVTKRGSQSLGALNWGADKVQLSDNFGNYLISKIESCI